jgi:hypothetical protein
VGDVVDQVEYGRGLGGHEGDECDEVQAYDGLRQSLVVAGGASEADRPIETASLSCARLPAKLHAAVSCDGMPQG